MDILIIVKKPAVFLSFEILSNVVYSSLRKAEGNFGKKNNYKNS